jgi:predicted nucleotidyltransferase
MNALVKAIAGSHLFGTNTPASDKDFKGVYLPSKEDILLGTAKSSVNTKTNNSGSKNTKDDVDVEFYSLQKFMQMLYEGQTVALELLWTPEDQIISTSPFWEELRSHRTELLHRKVTSFVGYCKTQADKYGVKGSRMGVVARSLHFLNGLTNLQRHEHSRMHEVWRDLSAYLAGEEHVSYGEQPSNIVSNMTRYVEICGRKYQETAKIDYVIDSLQKLYDSYGHRAKQAENNEGIDWKALSHAYRVCCQAIEILEDGKLSLPLKLEDRMIVTRIKTGSLSFKEFQPMLESKLAKVLESEKTSKLPADFDYDKWCVQFVMKVYKEEVNK